jgi:hypothetical protein
MNHLKLLACLFIFAPTAALADVPPPDDFVEECTVEKQTVPGLECESCRAWHGERDACDKTLGVKGMRRMCESWGASAWNEVWCKGEPTGPKPEDTPPVKKSNCAGGGLETLALPLLGLALVAARERRRRA